MTGLTNGITPGQKNAILWACRWHVDFEYGLMQTTEPRVVDFINDRFEMRISCLDDLTKNEASLIITNLSGKE